MDLIWPDDQLVACWYIWLIFFLPPNFTHNFKFFVKSPPHPHPIPAPPLPRIYINRCVSLLLVRSHFIPHSYLDGARKLFDGEFFRWNNGKKQWNILGILAMQVEWNCWMRVLNLLTLEPLPLTHFMFCSMLIGSLIVYFCFKPKNGSTLISEYLTYKSF